MSELKLDYLGIIQPGALYHNLTPAQLVEHALRRNEGTLSKTGALVVKTGKYTGRSPDDRFIVDEPSIHDEISWGKVNVPISPEKFDAIYRKACAYLQRRDVFVFDGFAGADPAYRKSFRLINELASQNLFIHQLLRHPSKEAIPLTLPSLPSPACTASPRSTASTARPPSWSVSSASWS